MKHIIHKNDIKSVHKVNSPSGPLYTITFKSGGQDHQVPIEYVEKNCTDVAIKLVYKLSEGRE